MEHECGLHSAKLSGLRVLVVGYRSAIVTVLHRFEIPFAIWHDKPIKKSLHCLTRHIAPFPVKAKEIRRVALQEFAAVGPITHVIAGTEASVYAASVCRRALNARKSKDSIAVRCSDKLLMKKHLQANGVPMTDFLSRAEAKSPRFVLDRLGPKVVVKSRRNSGGRGLTIAKSESDIAARTGRDLLYERFVDAEEMSVESIIRNGRIQFASATRYLVKRHANLVPANIPAPALEQALAINQRVIAALRLSWGLTHAEFYWSEDRVLFGEVALRPPGGYIMDCISLAYGFDAWEAFVANELELTCPLDGTVGRTAGVAMLHAGEGTVKAIEGVHTVRQLPTNVRFRQLVKPGEYVGARQGVSEVSAYGIFVSDSPEATLTDVLKCLELVRFRMAAPAK